MSITPQAMAATGLSTGLQPFCLANGECGEMYMGAHYVDVIGRGGVVAWDCVVTLPASTANPNFIGLTITDCIATNRWTGTDHSGLQNGNAGPGTATAGGSTTREQGGSYEVCVEGEALYVGGSYDFSGCSDVRVEF